jgi:hypothetical protein
VIFWLGKLAIEETIDNQTNYYVQSNFKGRLGHHIHGEIWATNKEVLKQNQLLDRPIHVISANMQCNESILPLRY